MMVEGVRIGGARQRRRRRDCVRIGSLFGVTIHKILYAEIRKRIRIARGEGFPEWQRAFLRGRADRWYGIEDRGQDLSTF